MIDTCEPSMMRLFWWLAWNALFAQTALQLVCALSELNAGVLALFLRF